MHIFHGLSFTALNGQKYTSSMVCHSVLSAAIPWPVCLFLLLSVSVCHCVSPSLAFAIFTIIHITVNVTVILS